MFNIGDNIRIKADSESARANGIVSAQMQVLRAVGTIVKVRSDKQEKYVLYEVAFEGVPGTIPLFHHEIEQRDGRGGTVHRGTRVWAKVPLRYGGDLQPDLVIPAGTVGSADGDQTTFALRVLFPQCPRPITCGGDQVETVDERVDRLERELADCLRTLNGKVPTTG